MEEVKKCSQCKREIYDAKICPFCGNIIEPESKIELNEDNEATTSKLECFNCGNIINKDDKFCAKCGIVLTSEVIKKKNLRASTISIITFFILPVSIYLAITKGLEEKKTLIYNVSALGSFLIQVYIALKYPKNSVNKVTSSIVVSTLFACSIFLLIVMVFCYIGCKYGISMPV